MHVTFLLLLGWVGASHWIRSRSVEAALIGAGFILALFGCVVLHELGHALAARRYGIGTRDITLLPIGGVARLERMPEKPGQEFVVAIAGPAVNVVIATVLYGWLMATGSWTPLEQVDVASGPLLQRLFIANVTLVLFNLIPAFPMDGGRILRALLATRMDYVKATQAAATVGQGLAFLFGFMGLFGNPMLLFVAMFVFLGASGEASATQMRAAMSGMPLRAAMLTDFRYLDVNERLSDAVRLILEGSQQDFPVLEDGRVVGILTRSGLIAALSEHGPEYPVAAAMQRDFPTIEDTAMLEASFQKLQESGAHTMPVLRGGLLAGLLTLENVAEYFMIQSAIKKSPQPLGAPPRFGPRDLPKAS
jgi:Zn-dependent protease